MKHTTAGFFNLIPVSLSLVALLAISPVMAGSSANCSTLKGCEQKLCELEMQQTLAKQSGDTSQVSSVQMALDNTRASCSDSRIKDSLTAKLAEANQDLVRFQAALQQAELAGEKQQILHYSKKLEQINSDIQRLKQQLNQLEQLPK